MEPSPCPFCKSPEAFVYEVEDESAGCSIFHVECEACGARGPVSEYKDGSILHWNGAARMTKSEPGQMLTTGFCPLPGQEH